MKVFLTSLFLVSILSAHAQRTFIKEWKRIDSLIEKSGLPKSALREVNAVYVAAKKEKNDVQAIRALVYRMTLNDQLSDSGRYENIELLEKEIKAAKEPAKSILHSITGAAYWQYLQMNRWQLYDRSRTKGYDNKDISTWGLEQLYERITAHFDSSVIKNDMLQKIALKRFDPILIKGNVRNLRPTLFDLLAFRALDYYRNDERYITKPVYAFEINDTAAFAELSVFIKHHFQSLDSLSLHFRALKLYQRLIRFHLIDVKADALIDADVDRLQFVKNFGTHADKDELYKRALENIIENYSGGSGVSPAIYALAEWYIQKGNTYDPLSDTTNRYALVKAKELCDKALAMVSANDSGVNYKNILKSILHRDLTMKAEIVNTTGDPFRVLVKYRNIQHVYLRVIKFDRDIRQKTGMQTWDDEFWKAITALPVIKTNSYSLPQTGDYQQHRVEIKIDSLPAGEYGIVMSAEKDFQLQKNALSLQHMYISDISYMSSKGKYYIVNRKTGIPLSGARIHVWEEYYHPKKEIQDLRKLQSYTTDDKGFFQLKKQVNNSDYNNIFLEIKYGADRLFQDKNENVYVYDEEKNSDSIQEQSLLFTDRSIYRPGQTVYVKGIVIRRKSKQRNNSVAPNRKITIILFNSNNEAVDSIQQVTNEFGSFSGKFILPSGVLNGQFSITDKVTASTATIRVEEYKRPKFEVLLSAPKGSYRVNDTIKVEGSAISYTGSNINGATVKYHVSRRAMMPMWRDAYMPGIWPPYPQEQVEITHGTIVADENGRFFIPFAAIPDKKITRSSHPIFYYSISADVTDINGETRSSNTTVSVAYEALKLQFDVPASMHTDSLKELSVITANMNDSFERAVVKLSIFKLNAPGRIFRARYWEQPDQFVMKRNEYYNYFPFDVYSDENDPAKWAKQNEVITVSQTTAPGINIHLNKKITEAGWYLIEAFTNDKYGDTVISRKYIQLYNNTIVSPMADVMIIADKSVTQPGDKLNYKLLTNIDSAIIVREEVRSGGSKKDLVKINNAEWNININETDRGGVALNLFFVRNNRFYSDALNIDVPYLNKQLKIDYISYRDKTLPGTDEKWKIKITGLKGEKVSAELLASMYDVSLDQFYPHTWSVPPLWEIPLDRSPWVATQNFGTEESFQRNYYDPEESELQKVYDRLIDETILSIGYSTIKRTSSTTIRGIATNAAVNDSEAAPFKETQVAYKTEQADTVYTKYKSSPQASILPRKNLNETAFFFPDLKTDSGGNVEFSFTSPEALTTWNWMLFAHTPDLAYVFSEKKIITQKQLMVHPNAPRFLREGDSINFAVKVSNLSAQPVNGQATLHFFDPSNGKEVIGLISKDNQSVKFNAAATQSVQLSFGVKIPSHFTGPLSWRIIASSDNKDGSLSDGEEDMIPVLSNRMLVTETMTLPVRGQKSKTFRFEKLINSGTSKTLKNHALSIEFTSNPAWYAVQALPYLSDVKDENAEQLFNRFYANALASKLTAGFPKLKSTIEKWNLYDTSAFMSNLQKNTDLKNIILDETPWVLEAKNEALQKKNISLLFDITRMSGALKTALSTLAGMQTNEGGLMWYKNGPPDRFMTQYIVSGIGHLKKLGAIPEESTLLINTIVRNAVTYLDNALKKDYVQIQKVNKKTAASTYLSYDPIQYLYMRSFFPDIPVHDDVMPAYEYFMRQVKQNWIKQNTYMRAMIALTLQRTGDSRTAKNIISALRESAIENVELGMYWKDMTGGYYWYQAPVETEALIIEAFNEITTDNNAIAEMKTWLLKNKQTNNWNTTKATAEACYALLLIGDNWIVEEVPVSIHIGDKIISASGNAEEGTGYFRKRIPGDSVLAAMGNVQVNMETNNISRPAWGAMYWQYFEDLDKITTSATALRIGRKLFKQVNTDHGIVLETVEKYNQLRVGDKIKVRMEIRTDRNLEYVHLKDMRSSCMEPVNVTSEYKWQDGLGYYESTKDASTNFFFTYLPKGTYVFEYDLFVTHSGNFNNGIATIQCMYAPEFSSHSEGIKVNVVK
ncbi:MAG TPA: alpha-2-macroglobulin family protein [Flavitalea sp.]|nr:alpha-2-macroglobulin family protein [Flavitalea sp.]